MKNLNNAVVEPAVKLFAAFLTATWLGFLFEFAPLCAQFYGTVNFGGIERRSMWLFSMRKGAWYGNSRPKMT